MNNDIIIKAENLYFSYDEEASYSLRGLNLEIKKGQKTAFMGSNGSGKSTFFLCCNGILKPSKGTLFFKGKPVVYDRKGLLELRKQVGIVFQDPDDQLFSASVLQEISFGILNTGISEEEAEKQVRRIMDLLEITPFSQKPAHALSGGQKKQVAIADILVMHPEVIILDEPASALDPKHTQLVNSIIDRLTDSGITVIMATHNADYAYEWADDIILMDQGQLLAHGTPQEIFQQRDLISKANLELPSVLKMFWSLVDHQVLDPSLPLPQTMDMLEKYIINCNKNKNMEVSK